MSLANLTVEEFMEKEWSDSSNDEGKKTGDNSNVKERKQKKRKRKKLNEVKPEQTELKKAEPKKSAKKTKKTISRKQKLNILKEKDKKENDETQGKMEESSEESGMEEAGSDEEGHQQQLDNLKKKDPEFYKFLQAEESSLLKFEDDVNFSDDEDDEEEVHEPPETLEEDSDESDAAEDAEEELKGKRNTKKVPAVTDSMVESWKTRLMCKEPSMKALQELMGAFHAALGRINEEGKEDKAGKKRRHRQGEAVVHKKFTVSGAKSFNAIVGLCIQCVPSSLASVLDYHPEESKAKKKKNPPLPSSCPRWSKVRPLVRLYLDDALTLTDSLMEASARRVFLRHLLLLMPYFLTFPAAAKNLLQMSVKLWSEDDIESVRVLAFFCITKLIKGNPNTFLEKTLKKCYLSYVANSKFTSPTTLPMINFMQRTFAELCAVNSELTYQHAFLYIRQLAIHLRKALTEHTKEAQKAVYNWQFVHSIGLWCRVISILHPNKELQPLIYPLVQVTLGAINMLPVIRYYPLRYRVLEYLAALGECTNVYIPLLHFITHPLGMEEFKRKKSGVKGKPITFDTMLKLANSQLSDKAYKDTTIDRVYDLLMIYLNSQAHTIAFPEMVVPTVVTIKKFIKDCQTPNYTKVLKQILDKVQENSAYIQEKRLEATFAVTDVEAVAAWEQRQHDTGVPFHKHHEQYVKNRRREVLQDIANKDRSVEENMPRIEREKFMQKSKQAAKMEFQDIFDSDDELLADNFKQVVIKDGGFKKPETEENPPEDEVEDGSEEEEVKEETKRPRVEVDLGSDDGEDIVEDLNLSDIE